MDGSEVQVLNVRLFSAQHISPAGAFPTPVPCVFLTDFCSAQVLNSQGRGDLQPRLSFSCPCPSRPPPVLNTAAVASGGTAAVGQHPGAFPGPRAAHVLRDIPRLSLRTIWERWTGFSPDFCNSSFLQRPELHRALRHLDSLHLRSSPEAWTWL